MAKQLIIVESPAKVKTIRKFLGDAYTVKASVGHVRDLPSSSLGVDEAQGFRPQYQVIENKTQVVNDLSSAAAKAEVVYLAPDPDREGEAIAWHIAELIRDKTKAKIQRIQFNEITERAVRDALAHPRELNENLFDAQQARRILDRLVGYKISPLLWKTVKRGISAGRVQSVALRLIVEREQEREAFRPEEYWPFRAFLSAGEGPVFKADLYRLRGKKALIRNAQEAADLEKALSGKNFVVASVEQKERERSPQPPFITSTLQQAANQRLGWTSKRTMGVAQRLYEGVELGERGLTALITYMRTDSTRIAQEAKDAAKNYIAAAFGESYLPKKSRTYKSKEGAQDAHEAIRPVDVALTPDQLGDLLPQEQLRLYKLIWTRFVASQMASARVHDTSAIISCGESDWRAKGEEILFPGFLALSRDDELAETELPPLAPGQKLRLEKLEKEQKFTQPPARYSEATLVRELEDQGIGRPSTYAAIISTLQDRDYVRIQDKRFVPTDLGRVVCRQLLEHFQRLMDVGFTAKMEEGLDKVAEGAENWVKLLSDFAEDFNPTLAAASKNMQSVKGGLAVDLPCPDCGRPLLIRFGKSGSFLACSGYPECRFSSDFARDAQGKVEAVSAQKPEYEKVGICPRCGKDLVIKKARTGSRFIACTGYPDCEHAAPFSTGVACPRCGQGALVEKSSRRGKIFYSCDQYPKCDFAIWDKPIPVRCPRCGGAYLVEKKGRSGPRVLCPNKGCGFVLANADAEAGAEGENA